MTQSILLTLGALFVFLFGLMTGAKWRDAQDKLRIEALEAELDLARGKIAERDAAPFKPESPEEAELDQK
jgi:hypothetical protein